MLMNIPISVLLVSGLWRLVTMVEFRWKVQITRSTSYLSHLEQKQLSVDDSRLSTLPPSKKWKRKIDSPVVEAAIEDFINKILQDFVIDLWYSDVTPDKEAPELIHGIVMDVLGEVSERIKEVNLIDLLTRDVVDMIGDHIELFRRNQAAIGVDTMRTFSFEERDLKLRHHLMASKELHPALISPECEYKVLQQLMGGVLAVVLRPREAQCPIVRCIARELLTCLVMQPIMNFASPGYINELIEYIKLAYNDGFKDVDTDQSPNLGGHNHEHDKVRENVQSSESSSAKTVLSGNQETNFSVSRFDYEKKSELDATGHCLSSSMQDEPMHPRSADWVKVFEAATMKRTEVLMPENLENMWAIGRNYKKKLQTKASTNELESAATGVSHDNRNKLKKSNSTSDLNIQFDLEDVFANKGNAPAIAEYNGAVVNKHYVHSMENSSDRMSHSEELHTPKLRCRVIGAYFEKLGSNSFAVYSIAVTDGDNKTWFVKRRYRNFERLHRHLKDIPNYNLHLPPKRIFSSSTEDAFVHQRCIQLDKYLQDLVSIANVAEQHEVWDFLSASSQNYSSGKSTSAMKTLAVNVDDAVDDILRQFKGVSEGLMRKMVGPPSSSSGPVSSLPGRNLSWISDDIIKLSTRPSISESINSFSDTEEGDKDETNVQREINSSAKANGWFPDNESGLNSKGYPPRVVNQSVDVSDLHSKEFGGVRMKSESNYDTRCEEPSLALTSVPQEDPTEVPPEWTPPNLSVPILNLVDNIFQLERRGWIRRQVFWISKQILQLVMEDAIDDWILRQIQWLRREDVVAQGIRWIQDVLWPDGTFFLRLRAQSLLNDYQANQVSTQIRQQRGRRITKPGSFEQQLEAARRASDVKKMIIDGAPATLVSLIGHKQYRRCGRDIYYFLQSTICLKQLGYGILELVLISIFPELREVVTYIHEKMHVQPV
ncbi:hypothetical protein F511_10277 [Dorcoceras hygrometricum]|uniref:Sorting nexin-16 n=1 Tax=Dorcoceras hygrometricum TaxID=472368 RepID=A0A2Z7C9N0_9LAMI|nr:hypothetical protein F511_10277 [Dorcoceras hygrometricum]